MASDLQPAATPPRSGPGWVRPAHALGLAFLLWQAVPLVEWLMCLALGSPLQATPHRSGVLGSLSGGIRLVALLGAPVVVLVLAAKEARETRSGSVLIAAPGLAVALVLILGALGQPPIGYAAFAVSTVICWLCAGLVLGRVGGSYAWRRRQPELASRTAGLLLGAAAGGAALFSALPRCVSQAYEGQFALSPVLVALTIASFAIARAIQARRAGAEPR
jgi:hypothetical protein